LESSLKLAGSPICFQLVEVVKRNDLRVMVLSSKVGSSLMELVDLLFPQHQGGLHQLELPLILVFILNKLLLALFHHNSAKYLSLMELCLPDFLEAFLEGPDSHYLFNSYLLQVELIHS